MAKRKTVTRYRDKDTGRFVSKKTWRRSRAQGGQRFVRTRIASLAARRRKPIVRKKRLRPRALPKPRKRKLTEEEIEEIIEEEEIEYSGAFDSP